ncbi:MAG: MurR/RpiR family transcriptional regulator [Firmicutes bacterium]|nr:MurR/RpiR family transcriptional regulator [Bacillota bacterium]
MAEKLSVALEQNKPNYSKSDLKIAAYVNAHMDTVMYDSLTEIAEKCSVGEATVLRFCRKLGYQGYQDFKLAAAMEIKPAIIASEHDGNLINRVYSAMQKSLEESYQLLDKVGVQQAVKWFGEYEDIVILGVGHSGISALDFQSRLLRVGKKAESVTDSHFQVMRASLATEQTLVIALSISGSTKDIVDAVARAKAKGAKVLAITSYLKSPLTKLSDLVIMSNGKEGPLEGGAMSGKVSQLLIVDVLCTGYALENGEMTQKVKQDAAIAVSQKIY